MLVIMITVVILFGMNDNDGPDSFAGTVIRNVLWLVPWVILALIVTAIKFNNTKKRLLQQLQTELATVSRSALANPAFMRDVS